MGGRPDLVVIIDTNKERLFAIKGSKELGHSGGWLVWSTPTRKSVRHRHADFPAMTMRWPRDQHLL